MCLMAYFNSKCRYYLNADLFVMQSNGMSQLMQGDAVIFTAVAERNPVAAGVADA